MPYGARFHPLIAAALRYLAVTVPRARIVDMLEVRGDEGVRRAADAARIDLAVGEHEAVALIGAAGSASSSRPTTSSPT